MKNLKKVLALVLAVVMIMGVVSVASAKTYKDVDSTNTYADAIDALSSLKILDGFEDETFKADGTLTRAQAAKIVAIVHNAATNGKIKDQDAISSLYSNALNPFVDCNSNWALPFINYCRITGLADGMTATTYAPNRELTGVQWLKLMLTTLNFDTAKEGYTGTGWDINVLNRANEIGLTAGLEKGWKAIAPITRGEAAQILYNALTKYLVEYGQLVKNTYVNSVKGDGTTADKDGYYKSSFISNEQVAKSGYTLAAKMDIKVERAYDVFGRPGYKWSYSTWSKFYMDAPLASFTTAATTCDILVGAGIDKTSTETLDYVQFVNGAYTSDASTPTLSHANRACEKVDDTHPSFGSTGALTQIFVVGTKYIITTIDTQLAKVVKVADDSKHGNGGTATTLLVYNRGASYNKDIVAGGVLNFEGKFAMGSKDNGTTVVASGLEGYAKGDYVLVHMSTVQPTADVLKDYNFYTGDAVVETSATTTASADVCGATIATASYNGAYLVAVKAADSKVQKLTGRALNDTSKITLDGEKVPTARGYILDEAHVAGFVVNADGDTTTDVALLGNSYTFFRDQYNNVIGDIESTEEINYALVEGIVWITNGATYSDGQSASAGIVKAGENAVTDVTVAKVAKGIAAAKKTSGSEQYEGYVDQATVSTVKTNNGRYTAEDNFHGVVKYSVDADGKYTLYYNDGSFISLCDMAGFAIESKNPNIPAETAKTTKVVADDETIFLVKTMKDGKVVYTSYTGISNVPTMKVIKHAVAVVEAGERFASFIYVDATNAVFTGSKTIAFVAAVGANYEEKDVVYTYDYIYINGVKTPVDVLKSVTGDPDHLFAGTGLYELNYDADGKVCAVRALNAVDDRYANDEVVAVNGNIVNTVSGLNLNVSEAKIYFVLDDGAGNYTNVVEKTAADLERGMWFRYTYTADGQHMVDSLYVISVPQD